MPDTQEEKVTTVKRKYSTEYLFWSLFTMSFFALALFIYQDINGRNVPETAKVFFKNHCARFGPNVKVGSLIAFKEEGVKRIYGSCVIEYSDGKTITHEKQIDMYDIIIK